MNRNQIAMLSIAALVLALIAARRKRKAMMAAADMPPAMPIKEVNDGRPEALQMPQSISRSVSDNIVENLREPIPPARVPVEPLAQDFRTRNIVDPARVTVEPFGAGRRRNIILSDI
jgi:hypothetical protein